MTKLFPPSQFIAICGILKNDGYINPQARFQVDSYGGLINAVGTSGLG